MKRVFFICVSIIIIFVFTFIFFYEKYEKSIVHPLEYINSTYEYECYSNDIDCKIYFFNTLYPMYIKKNEYKSTHSKNYKFKVFDYNKKNYIKGNKIILYNGEKIFNKLKFDYDKNLNGIYEFNGETYKFSNGCINSSNTTESPRPCTPLHQLDNNIFSIIEPIISEIPIYEYEFDEENNLILYPLATSYNYIDKHINYKLKRLK